MVALASPPVAAGDDARVGWSSAQPQNLLRASVEALAAEDIDGLSDHALGDDLIDLRRQIDRLEAEFARRLFRFDRCRGYAAEGAPSVVSWLRHTCRLAASTASHLTEVARRLPDLPLTQAALRSEEIGFQHAAVIARSAGEVGTDVVVEMEPTLVEAAKKLDPGRLRLVTRHLRHCVDPDGALGAANADHERRWLQINQTFGGVFAIDGLLDAEGGALLRTAIDALAMPHPGEMRTAAQRRADALVELATRQLQGGELPSSSGQRPHLTVTVSEETLAREPGAPGGDERWAGAVPAEMVRRLACDAVVTRVTLSRTGQPLDVGRATRTIPPALRRALELRDRTCRFPGCDRLPQWTDAHHLRHWADGGETRLDNLVLLCRHHHRVAHERGWRLRWGPDGVLMTRPP